MPEYLYENPKNGKVISVIQSVHDKHEYVDESGLKWNRVFTVPEVNIDAKLTADSSAKDFIKYTSNKKGNMGNLWDASKELSEKREKMYGKDPIKKKYFENWSKKRKGKKHPLDRG
jgi:hypothetical protein